MPELRQVLQLRVTDDQYQAVKAEMLERKARGKKNASLNSVVCELIDQLQARRSRKESKA